MMIDGIPNRPKPIFTKRTLLLQSMFQRNTTKKPGNNHGLVLGKKGNKILPAKKAGLKGDIVGI